MKEHGEKGKACEEANERAEEYGWGEGEEWLQKTHTGPTWAPLEEAREPPAPCPGEDQKTQEPSGGREKTKTDEPSHTPNICVSNKAIGFGHLKITHKLVR